MELLHVSTLYAHLHSRLAVCCRELSEEQVAALQEGGGPGGQQFLDCCCASGAGAAATGGAAGADEGKQQRQQGPAVAAEVLQELWPEATLQAVEGTQLPQVRPQRLPACMPVCLLACMLAQQRACRLPSNPNHHLLPLCVMRVCSLHLPSSRPMA